MAGKEGGRQPGEKPAKKTGRPSKLTPELQDEIVRRIEGGNFPTVAAGACGVPHPTFLRWMKRGEKGEEPYASFSDAVARAMSESEANAVETISAASVADWRAAAWRLERQQSARWAAKIKVVRDDEARHLLSVARDVLAEQDFLRLLGALAAADRARDAGEGDGGGETVH